MTTLNEFPRVMSGRYQKTFYILRWLLLLFQGQFKVSNICTYHEITFVFLTKKLHIKRGLKLPILPFTQKHYSVYIFCLWFHVRIFNVLKAKSKALNLISYYMYIHISNEGQRILKDMFHVFIIGQRAGRGESARKYYGSKYNQGHIL